MIAWIIIGLILIIGSIFLKFEHHGKKFLMAIAVLVGLLLYFSISAIFNSADTDLSSPKNVIGTFYSWAGWFGNTVSGVFDIGKDAVIGIGNVIKGNNSTPKSEDGRR